MKDTAHAALERAIAFVLSVGTWLASAVVSVGLALSSHALMSTGIALFIALPVFRVAMMVIAFLRRRDYRIGVISALVLAVILLGIAIGLRSSVVAT